MTTEEMRDEIYKLYRLDWMSFQGYDPIELCETIAERVADRINDEIGYPYSSYDVGQGRTIGGRWYEKGTSDIVEEEIIKWEKGEGFNGSIWADMDEFLESVYKNASYVYDLISRSQNKKELWDAYLKDVYGNE